MEGNGRKSKYYEFPTMPLPSSFSKATDDGKHSSDSKRVTVLNKVFMRYITELMATGENCSVYLGHSIQVNYVSTCVTSTIFTHHCSEEVYITLELCLSGLICDAHMHKS